MALAARVDPFLVRAVIEHESHGREAAINPSSKCIGLMQICPWTLSACRAAPEGDLCATAKARLLGGEANIHLGAQRLAEWGAFCRKRTGRAEHRHVLSGYGGTDGRGITCGQRRVGGRWRDVPTHKVVAEVLAIVGRLRGVW